MAGSTFPRPIKGPSRGVITDPVRQPPTGPDFQNVTSIAGPIRPLRPARGVIPTLPRPGLKPPTGTISPGTAPRTSPGAPKPPAAVKPGRRVGRNPSPGTPRKVGKAIVVSKAVGPKAQSKKARKAGRSFPGRGMRAE